MVSREIGIGFILGLAANVLGVGLYILIFSDTGIERSLLDAYQENVLGRLIAAGAVLNFIPFFFFLNQNRIYRARGVVLASIMAALAIGVIQLTRPGPGEQDNFPSAEIQERMMFSGKDHFS